MNREQLNKYMQGKNLVLFYRDSCPYCVQLKPAFNETIKAWQPLKAAGVGLRKVDTVEYATYADDFPALREHITGVPTLLFFDNGAITRYEGPRSADSIIETTMKHFSI